MAHFSHQKSCARLHAVPHYGLAQLKLQTLFYSCTDLCVIHGLDAALDPQHLPHSILIAMLFLKLFPRVPKCGSALQTKDISGFTG